MNLEDIQPLSDFQRNARAHIRRAKQTGLPSVLTVNGHAEIVLQDVKSYQALVAKAEEADNIRRLRRRLASARAGHVYDAERAFDALEEKHFGKIVSRSPRKRKKK